jgi:hypothetical protein
MSKTLDLEVYGSENRLTTFLGRHEAELESDASEIAGEPVEFEIMMQGCLSGLPTRFTEWSEKMIVLRVSELVNSLGKIGDSNAQMVLRKLIGNLVIAERSVFHDPVFQMEIFSQSQSNRIRFLVNDEPEFENDQFLSNFRDLFGSLLTEAADEDPQEAERNHSPYLRVSRLIRNEESGRLDAVKVAEFFGLTPTELARIVDVKRQTLFKTPDSLNLQKKLYPFEEITRGLLMVDDDPTLFRQWLNTPSRELPKIEGQHMTPMEMIRKGHPSVVAGLVDAALTGHPS